MNDNKRGLFSAPVAAAGAALATLSGGAMATGTGGFDSSTVITKITNYGVEATLIVGAFILAVWGLKAMGLFKRG
jgi:hypothetical protein